MKSSCPTIIILGCGYMGTRHALVYARIGGVRLILIDEDEDRALRLAGQATREGVPCRTGTWPELLQNPKIAVRQGILAVDICTPPQYHTLYARQALEAGCPVLCEKPLTTSVEEENALLSLAERSPGWLSVAYPYRHHPALQWGRNILTGGGIGKPHLAYFRLGARGGRSLWKHRDPKAGGAASEVLCHLIDLATFYFGPACSGDLLDQGICWSPRPVEGQSMDVTVPDYILMRLQHREGTQSMLLADMASPGFMQSVEIQGNGGGIWMSIHPDLPSLLQPVPGMGQPRQSHHPSVDLLQRVLTAFVDSIRRGQPDSNLAPYPGETRWLQICRTVQ